MTDPERPPPVSLAEEEPDPLATAQPGGRAYQMYLDMVNVGRRGRAMLAVPQTKTIDQQTPTRYAVVQVLTTSTGISCGEVVGLLANFSYTTTKSKVRGSCRRMRQRGLVTKTSAKLKGRWCGFYKLTAEGSTFALAACGYNAKGKGSTHLAKGSGGTRTRSKGSAGRTSSMCNVNPNQPTFNSAVKFILAGMVAAKETFSAHDVTRKVRDQVGNLKIDTTETGVVHVGGQSVARIDHDAVKEIVAESFQLGEMTDYVREHTGQYFEYKYQDPAAAPATPDPTSDPSSTPPAADGSSYTGTPTL